MGSGGGRERQEATWNKDMSGRMDGDGRTDAWLAGRVDARTRGCICGTREGAGSSAVTRTPLLVTRRPWHSETRRPWHGRAGVPVACTPSGCTRAWTHMRQCSALVRLEVSMRRRRTDGGAPCVCVCVCVCMAYVPAPTAARRRCAAIEVHTVGAPPGTRRLVPLGPPAA